MGVRVPEELLVTVTEAALHKHKSIVLTDRLYFSHYMLLDAASFTDKKS